MPYIKQERRSEIHMTPIPESAGELNYMITLLLIRYWRFAAPSYQRANDIVGAC